MAEWIDVEAEWAYWVNPDTLRMPRLKGRVPVGAVVLLKFKDEFVVTEYHLAGPEGLEELAGKKAASAKLAAQVCAYMAAHRSFPPAVTVKKAYKNGGVDLAYAPGNYDAFTLRVTKDLLGEDPGPFLEALAPFDEASAPASLPADPPGEPGAPEAGSEASAEEPWCIEPAKSARAKCRTCFEKIDKYALRLGEPSFFEENKSYKWHHLACAIGKVEDLEALEGLNALDEAQRAALDEATSTPF